VLRPGLDPMTPIIPTMGARERASSNDKFVADFIAAWERRDSAYVVDCFTEDAVYHSIPLTPIVGKPAIRAWVEHFAEVPPGRLEVHHQVASGNLVMNERTDHITLNGKPVVLSTCGVFEIEDGRIKAWREYFDLGPAKAAYDG
jgi:limonene-1,2-epoxide hydrolase